MADFASLSEVHRIAGKTLDQGDIVDRVYFGGIDDFIPGVLVTPACDLEHDKVELITFVGLFPEIDVARQVTDKQIKGFGQTLTKKQRESVETTLKELVSQRLPRYHWLPIGGGLIADFTCITSIPLAEARAPENFVMGSLCSSWREQLPARYVSYMGRVGTKDIAPSEIDAVVARICKALIGSVGGEGGSLATQKADP